MQHFLGFHCGSHVPWLPCNVPSKLFLFFFHRAVACLILGAGLCLTLFIIFENNIKLGVISVNYIENTMVTKGPITEPCCTP